MINRAILVGRITRDPELRMTSSNVAVVTFTLAVNRTFTDQSGERQADFVSCVAWRRQAEFLANYVKKGALIGVDGRIQTRSYEAEGGMRYITEVVAESLQILESKDAAAHRGQDVKPQETEEADNDAYYETSKALAADDDLPF